MAKSYSDLQKQIASLQAEAERIKKAELADVIAKIKTAIKAYDITPKDLFGTRMATSTRSKASGEARYRDEDGNVWGGRGPRPQWLRDALAEGKSLEDFALGAVPKAAAPAAKKRAVAGRKSAAAKKAPVKYRDDSGNTWSGRGLKPRWLKAALDSGRSLEDFRT